MHFASLKSHHFLSIWEKEAAEVCLKWELGIELSMENVEEVSVRKRRKVF